MSAGFYITFIFFGVAVNLSCSIKQTQHSTASASVNDERRETKRSQKGFIDSLLKITQSKREHRRLKMSGKLSFTFSVLVNYKLHPRWHTQFVVISAHFRWCKSEVVKSRCQLEHFAVDEEKKVAEGSRQRFRDNKQLEKFDMKMCKAQSCWVKHDGWVEIETQKKDFIIRPCDNSTRFSPLSSFCSMK